MRKYELTVTFIEPVLGSQPKREVASEFLRQKAIEKGATPEDVDQSIDSIPESLEKGTTGFHRDEAGNPVFYNYIPKGFLKEAGNVFNADGNSAKIKNLRAKIAATVFVEPRVIPLVVPEGAEGETYNERPLRAQTAQGPRVGLARSEQLPAGTSFTCRIVTVLPTITEDVLRELLDYGQYQGLGQWRSGGWGNFTYTLKPVA